jgi:hypothetical protein
MAIAMEFFNIIVPKAAIVAKYPGGIAQYRKDGGLTLLEDEYLTRGGAMNWYDVEMIVRQLESLGLRHLDENGKAVDIVVVDMLRGPTSPCDWVDFDNAVDGPRCWLHGTEPGKLSKPNRPDIEKDRHFAFLSNGRVVPIGKPKCMSILDWLGTNPCEVPNPIEAGNVTPVVPGSIYVSWFSNPPSDSQIREQIREK